MNFTPLIRNLALQHTATACVNDLCLLCELGFLFDMLEKAEGSICQATNLLKTLSNYPNGKILVKIAWTCFNICHSCDVTAA
jgi:PAB-dependent poly(A)-specific ribonuclease subunit 2